MKAVLFDLDGTLVDSIELIVACFTKTIEAHLNYTPEREWILSKIGKPLRPILEELLPGSGHLLTATYRDHQYAYHDEYVSMFPGIDTMLAAIGKDRKLGIVTSKGRGGTEKALTYIEAAKDIFLSVITADDSVTHKPEPHALLQGLEEINKKFPNEHIQPQECYYVGDTVFDMQAAIAAEMKPIGVTWGVAKKEVLSAYTDLIADTREELSKIIQGIISEDMP